MKALSQIYVRVIMNQNLKISDVAQTLLITLYCHALESQSRDPILDDPKAVEITHELDRILSDSKNKLDQDLANGKLKKELVTHIAIRARQYDRYVSDFLIDPPTSRSSKISHLWRRPQYLLP